MADEKRLKQARRLVVELGAEIFEFDVEKDGETKHYWSWRIPWPRLPTIEYREGSRRPSEQAAVHECLVAITNDIRLIARGVEW